MAIHSHGSAPQSGFVWDEASGYYYDAASGFYYDGNTGTSVVNLAHILLHIIGVFCSNFFCNYLLAY